VSLKNGITIPELDKKMAKLTDQELKDTLERILDAEMNAM
jgi:hypothetical protein